MKHRQDVASTVNKDSCHKASLPTTIVFPTHFIRSKVEVMISHLSVNYLLIFPPLSVTSLVFTPSRLIQQMTRIPLYFHTALSLVMYSWMSLSSLAVWRIALKNMLKFLLYISSSFKLLSHQINPHD